MMLQPLSARPVLASRGSMRATPRGLAPLSPRAETSRPSTTSAAVRGGGRLYTQSPIDGYSEAEMIREARLRIEHNKQRQKLKYLLSTASQGGPTVQTEDLLLACKLAKMNVDDKSIQGSGVGFSNGQNWSGHSPRAVTWKNFHQSLEYPRLHGRGAFGELPPTRSQRKLAAHLAPIGGGDGKVNLLAAGDPDSAVKLQATDQEVYNHWFTLKRLMETRFSEIRRAFRLIDEDSSGSADKQEMKFMLNAMFNLNIPDHVMDRLIDLADYDGDGSINFAEFARVMTSENILNMKKTLVADVSNWGAEGPEASLEVDSHQVAAANRKMAAGGYDSKMAHTKLRRTGPGIDAIRRAHQVYKKAILARYSDFKEAFKAIDADNSGLIRRAELRRFMRSLSKTISDKVISALIDFCDSDGDAKTLDVKEFVTMMKAETLGAGGYDPNAPPGAVVPQSIELGQ